MREFDPEEGMRVRIDIPDETDPDHDAFHGRHGTIIDTITDDAASETGDPRDSVIYRIEFEGGSQADFRWSDSRPPLDER